MENQDKALRPPEDLAGYQLIESGAVLDGDIIVHGGSRFKEWAVNSIGFGVEYLAPDSVYRKMACPSSGDNDKSPSGCTYGELRAERSGHNLLADDIPSSFEQLRQAGLNQAKAKTHDGGKPALESFSTGSLRQSKSGKGRFDLIPYEPTKQLAIHFEDGGKFHGDRNWELGQPLSVYASSAKRHAMQAGLDFSENHAIASCWNFFCLLQTAKWIEEGKLPRELDDIGWKDSS